MAWMIFCLLLAPVAWAAPTPTEITQGLDESAIKKQHLGCYKDNPKSRDLPYLGLTSATDNTIRNCVRFCREQGFRFAGLQNSVNCYCGNNAVRTYDEGYDCKMACSGDSTTTCGGASSSDVYVVSSDDKYQGCYKDKSNGLDLPFYQWGPEEGKSAVDCVHQCSILNYKYAGVKNGGGCYCGNEFGRHGGADELSCNVRCVTYARQNCGGETTNAIYRTETAGDMSSGATDFMATRLYDNSGSVSGIPTTLFTLFPWLRTVLTKRLIIHTSTPVLTPIEDSACAGNCYTPCGEVYHEEGLTNTGDDVTLRFFFLQLGDITKYVGPTTKRVFVYAQTVLVDRSVDFKFSLLVRTKQLIMDRSKAYTINTALDGKVFDIDVMADRFNDVEPNVMQQKMALTCAKILMDTKQRSHRNTAFSIVGDVAYTRTENTEAKSVALTARGYIGAMTGIDRDNINFVPFYTKTHLSDVLETYYKEIDIYRKNYDAIEKSVDNTASFLSLAEALTRTYAETDITEASTTYDAAVTAVQRSNATYHRLRWYYEDARTQLEDARVIFEKGIHEKEGWDIANAVIKFITGIGSIVTGAISFDKDEMEGSVGGIVDDVTGLFDTAYNLANTVRQIDELSLMADKIIDELEDTAAATDCVRFLDDLDFAVQLSVNIVKWENLKNYGTAVLADPEVLRVRGAADYHRQLLDVCNWGEALTRSMVERAELLRQSIDARSILDAKKAQKERIQKHIDDTRNGLIPDNHLVMAEITEQSYDVRMDLNEALVTFCQAYFYENMYECRDSYKPSFGGSLYQLLVKINAASLDGLLVGTAPSSVEREITISDTDKSSECNDAKVCPLNYMRNHRVLHFNMPTSYVDLIDIDAYKLAEIKLNFTGVKTKNPANPWLKVLIESSGEFKGRANKQTFNFLTRATSVTFEYNIFTNHVSIAADIAAPFRNIVQNVTPFTTWVMRVSPDRSADIDLSDVTSIRMRFAGSGLDNETWKKAYQLAHHSG